MEAAERDSLPGVMHFLAPNCCGKSGDGGVIGWLLAEEEEEEEEAGVGRDATPVKRLDDVSAAPGEAWFEEEELTPWDEEEGGGGGARPGRRPVSG